MGAFLNKTGKKVFIVIIGNSCTQTLGDLEWSCGENLVEEGTFSVT